VIRGRALASRECRGGRAQLGVRGVQWEGGGSLRLPAVSCHQGRAGTQDGADIGLLGACPFGKGVHVPGMLLPIWQSNMMAETGSLGPKVMARTLFLSCGLGSLGVPEGFSNLWN
jgi:hypothetical protein